MLAASGTSGGLHSSPLLAPAAMCSLALRTRCLLGPLGPLVVRVAVQVDPRTRHTAAGSCCANGCRWAQYCYPGGKSRAGRQLDSIAWIGYFLAYPLGADPKLDHNSKFKLRVWQTSETAGFMAVALSWNRFCNIGSRVTDDIHQLHNRVNVPIARVQTFNHAFQNNKAP